MSHASRISLLLAVSPFSMLEPLPGSGAAADDPPPAAVDAAVQRGVDWLLANQELDGSWNYGDGPRIGSTALIAYTLLKSGIPPAHHSIQRAIAHLEGEGTPGQTYDVATLILALAAHDARRHSDWIQELVDQLLDWQSDVGWGYPGGGDLSNTQYAALGLWAGARHGAKVPERAWMELVGSALGYRTSDGGFSYRQGDGATTGSMTAAGLGVLAICREQLDWKERSKRRKASRLDEAIAESQEWLARNFAVDRNPGRGGAHLGYYIYGLERAAALAGVESFGEHDWYREGTRFLVANQNEAGHWGQKLGAGHPQTCFAMLFLRRATAPLTGEQRSLGGRRYTQGEESTVRVTASGDNPMSMWITGMEREARARLEWPAEQGMGPRVSRVVWMLDGIEVARLVGDSGRPLGHQRFAHQHAFTTPGAHEIVAQLHILRPPRTDATGREWPSTLKIEESAPLRVEVTGACPEWMLENARDRRRNVLPSARPSVSASSALPESGPGRVLDQRQGTAWLARPDDERPTLTLTMASPVQANVVVIGHARTTPFRPGRWARALEVEVTVNGADRYRLRMYPDERQKGRLELPRVMRVERLDLVIPWKVPGEEGEQSVGLAEVELQLRED